VRGLLLILIILSACSPSLTQKRKKKEDPNPKPSWMAAKPPQDVYYIGIGHSLKQPSVNHIQAAKNSALEDLISEIRVTISGSSVLSSIDANKEFSEKYEQIIKTTVADEIQEFEQVGTWEDAQHYWVYYRLSKARYKQIKDELKRNAVAQALDFFTKAKQADRNNDIVLSLGFYYQGFRAIEKYLAEPIRLEFEGKEILLTNEIISSMQLVLDRLKITATPSEIQINRRVDQNSTSVTVKVEEKSKARPIQDMPLRAAFDKGSGDVFPDYKTDALGQAKVLLTKISSRDLEQTVGVGINMLAFAGQNPSEIYSMVSAKMVVPKAEILLKVKRPVVYMTAIEKSLGMSKSNMQVSNKIKNYLANNGFEFSESKERADFLLDITADSEKGSVSGSIYITFVTAVIRVATTQNNKEIYTTTLDRVKGYSLDYERSSQEAYNKALETLDREKLPELLNAILQ
jgi:LPP20 lipoprotein